MDSDKKFWVIFLSGVALAFCCVCGLAVALITAGVTAANWQFPPDGSPLFNPRIGQLAPDFELTNLKDETIHLSELRGQPVVINFWASWCSPCAAEMPIFQDFSEQYPGLQFYAINAGESATHVQNFADENDYTFNILLDPDETVNSDYRITAIPATFFLDSEGRIAAIQIGSMTEKQFEKYLKEIGIPQE